MTKKSEILEELKLHLLKNFGRNIKNIILFGSHATGKETRYSDYDVLIVLDKHYSGKDENRIMDLCYDIDLKYDIILDIHILSESELNSARGRQPVFRKAIKSGIYA